VADDEQTGQLDQEMANLLSRLQDAVERLAEVPGLAVDSAHNSGDSAIGSKHRNLNTAKHKCSDFSTQ
jgi:hypothetical protein